MIQGLGYDYHFEIPGFQHLHHHTENVNISDCNLQSYSSWIRIGFLDQNDVKNVQVNNVHLFGSNRGIGIFLRDQGSLENISFSNMTIETGLHTGDWWGNGEPIHISAIRDKDSLSLGHIKNIHFFNITCLSENGIVVWGTPENIIRELYFEHIRLDLVDSKLNDIAGGNVDLEGQLG